MKNHDKIFEIYMKIKYSFDVKLKNNQFIHLILYYYIVIF